MESRVLEVAGLNVVFQQGGESVRCVRDVSFFVKEGECLALVGESGCGKSVTVKSIMGLIGLQGGKVDLDSHIRYCGDNILKYSDKQWEKFRGDDAAMIFQDAMAALNPTVRVEKQIEEMIQNHRECTKKEAEKQTIELLRKVGIPQPEKRARQYPHEFSGGMRQRVMIAMAIACSPSLLIADEPTTALDVVVQSQILDMLQELQREEGMSMILVTHDFGVVARMADRVAVMYSGRIVEQGAASDIFYHTRHPYTKALLKSQPRLNDKKGKDLYVLDGAPPDLKNVPEGCPFCGRCSQAMQICLERVPKFTEFESGHFSACWMHQIEEEERTSKREEPWIEK